jgi:hypothetical protein
MPATRGRRFRVPPFSANAPKKCPLPKIFEKYFAPIFPPRCSVHRSGSPQPIRPDVHDPPEDLNFSAPAHRRATGFAAHSAPPPGFAHAKIAPINIPNKAAKLRHL